MNRANVVFIVLLAVVSPALFAQDSNAVKALPAIITLLQSEQLEVIEIASGRDHTCALFENGTVKCWGGNAFGQLGNNSTLDSLRPVNVVSIENATSIAAGAVHTCALLTSGSVRCWGNGSFGQLGHASTNHSSVPVGVIGISNAVSISLGAGHSCVRLSGGPFLSGPVKCWGSNSDGQLGNGLTTNSTIPVDVSNLGNVSKVSLGSKFSCARPGSALIVGGGTIKCWGNNIFGQLGNNSDVDSLVPVTVVGISNVIDFDSYSAHSCAVLADSSAVCWGINSAGQLGDGTTDIARVPVPVASLRGFREISLGSRHTCARTQDNSSPAILCWGDNNFGALGDGTNNSSLIAVLVTNLDASDASISVGERHTCALLSDSSVKCWGSNVSGQLGDGSQANSSTPVTVLGL